MLNIHKHKSQRNILIGLCIALGVVAIPLILFIKSVWEFEMSAGQESPQHINEISGGIYTIGKKLLGFEGKRTYLILLQNNHELRPTGGFIGQYAIVQIENGKILTFFTQDAGVLDTQAPKGVQVPRAPLAVQTYLNQNFLFFRDSNWDPQFNTSAQHIAKTYALERGQLASQIDGVIAIDTLALETIMKYIEPITIENITFTHENIIDVLEYEVEVAYKQKGIHKVDRKQIIEHLGKEILARAKNLPKLTYVSLMQDMLQLAEEKHILGFDYDPHIQQWYEQNNYDGTVKYHEGNFIQVIDANLNAFKTDRLIGRAITHNMNIEENLHHHVLELTYTHNGTQADYRTRQYRTYTRVRVPLTAQGLRIPGDTFNEHGNPGFDVKTFDKYKEVGFFISVPLAQNKTVPIKFTTPAQNDISYTYIKQPGVIDPQLTVRWSSDTTLAQMSSKIMECVQNTCAYEGLLSGDKSVGMSYSFASSE